MEQIVLNQNDELVMKLLHYFITEKGYSPIILHGAKDEIWLENLDSDYQVVRIVSNYIHNDEQLNFDLFRTNQIMKQIKKKTFSININTLSLFLNLGDSVHIDNYLHHNNVDCAQINNIDDLKKYDFIVSTFPNITKKTSFKEKGMNLFLKLTNEIGLKNEKENLQNEEIFKVKKPIITYILIGINILVYLLVLSNKNILNFLALQKANFMSFQLVTSAFTHYDIFHIIFNMYALYEIGSQIENFIGKGKFIIVYFLSLLGGNLLSLTFMASDGASIGASGAIFGLFGSLLYFGYHYRVYLGNVMRSQIIPLIIFNLCLGFMITGIDNAAHIGGLIAGILITMALGIKYKSKKDEKINGLILSIIYFSFLIYTAFIR